LTGSLSGFQGESLHASVEEKALPLPEDEGSKPTKEDAGIGDHIKKDTDIDFHPFEKEVLLQSRKCLGQLGKVS
jgi:hypothetical protein